MLIGVDRRQPNSYVYRQSLLEMAGTESENSAEAMRLELLVKRLALLSRLSAAASTVAL